jgi:hypothetical protein
MLLVALEPWLVTYLESIAASYAVLSLYFDMIPGRIHVCMFVEIALDVIVAGYI